MMVQRGKLMAYYKNNVLLKKLHSLSLYELDEMMPWERNIYISLLNQYTENQNKD